jgi:hypothetical protein
MVGDPTFVAGCQPQRDAQACLAERIEHDDKVPFNGCGAMKLAQLVGAPIGGQHLVKPPNQ